MKTRRRKKYNTRKYGNKRIRYNKRKSRKRCNAKKKKSRRRRNQRKNLTETGRGLWDYDAYEIDILGEEPVILDYGGMTEDERLQHKTEEFSNNFLRTGIINWKIMAREQEINRMERMEPGWEFVHGGDHDEDNYVKYLLEQMPENITNIRTVDDSWIRADNAGLATEASSLLVGDLTDKTGENYWIDGRVLGGKWRGVFDATNAHDEIRIIDPPV